MLNNRKAKLAKLLDGKLKEILTGNEKEAKFTVLFKPENIFYFTNYWGEGIAIIDNDMHTKLMVPKLEYNRAESVSQECEVKSTERGKMIIDDTLDLIKGDNVSIFSDVDNFEIATKMQRKVDRGKFFADQSLFYKLREIKDEQEIEKIKKASVIVDRLFKTATEEIKENVTEEYIQSVLVFEALKLGARFPAYQYTSNPLIIASGPNGAFPHAETSNKKIKPGDLIVIDITLSYKHYISDATRTFGLGKVCDEARQVYNIVKASQAEGINQIEKTNNFSDIDSSCRNLITDNGYGQYFIHSTGHGIGLEVHEPPWIRPNLASYFQDNMAVTIEPGIYLHNKFGVRIEDSIVLKQQGKDESKFGSINLHSFTKDLLVL
jgi:Xaa-Pro aminopeptidase